MEPSLAARVAFFMATDTPFLRNRMIACSRSPLASVRACLQSIMGAPVFSRRSFTCAAEIFAIVVLIEPQVSKLQSLKEDQFGGPVREPIKVATLKLCNLETLKPAFWLEPACLGLQFVNVFGGSAGTLARALAEHVFHADLFAFNGSANAFRSRS